MQSIVVIASTLTLSQTRAMQPRLAMTSGLSMAGLDR